MRIVNQYSKPHRKLDGIADGIAGDAEWDTLKAKLLTWLEDQATEVLEDAARAIDPKFADQHIWNQIASDLHLMIVEELPVPEEEG